MYHPMYHYASRLVGKQVYVHHMNGTMYHGTLTAVQPSGVYVFLHPPGSRFATANSTDLDLQRAIGSADVDAEMVYWPGAYFAFGALTGLTAAALFSPFVW